jgi:hypothetical protein
MLKKKVNRLVKICNMWRLVQITLAVCIIISIGIFVLELAIPLQLNSDTANSSNINTIALNSLSKIVSPKPTDFREVVKIIRSGLFKSETSLRDKPMADKTIGRIISQLKLQCIMELDGESVAYVNINGVGMKKCKVGDSIDDLFTVLNINNKSIEITIVDHREILSL